MTSRPIREKPWKPCSVCWKPLHEMTLLMHIGCAQRELQRLIDLFPLGDLPAISDFVCPGCGYASTREAEVADHVQKGECQPKNEAASDAGGVA